MIAMMDAIFKPDLFSGSGFVLQFSEFVYDSILAIEVIAFFLLA